MGSVVGLQQSIAHHEFLLVPIGPYRSFRTTHPTASFPMMASTSIHTPPVSTTPPNVSCIRCTDVHLQCKHAEIFPRSKFLCNECDAAGLDSCFFPSSVCLLDHRCNSTCSSCNKHHQKCIFMDVTDTQCIHCSKKNIPCVFKMNGKCFCVNVSMPFSLLF
jgi:hypothetical protein